MGMSNKTVESILFKRDLPAVSAIFTPDPAAKDRPDHEIRAASASQNDVSPAALHSETSRSYRCGKSVPDRQSRLFAQFRRSARFVSIWTAYRGRS